MGYGNTEVFLTSQEREKLIWSMMGTKQKVIIDRPVGYVHHTKGITLHYPINYGYIPGAMGGDGEEQDVYILGVNEPLEVFEGSIIAAVCRTDDNEDKLVAAPEGMHFTREEIEDILYFTEQYFDSTVVIPRKIFLLSFDDGTIWDKRFVELLNRYQIPCTFNLNSGLEDFVWKFEGKPILRQKLVETVEQYRGHEVASHTLHHHWLNSLTPPQLRREVEEDAENIKNIFGLSEVGFGVPFTACDEREVNILRKFVRYIRLSEFTHSFALPKDEYHIPIHGLYNDPDIREKIATFAQNSLPVSLFVMAGHSYEFEMLDHWDYMEDLLQYIQSFGFEIMTTMNFVKEFYP